MKRFFLISALLLMSSCGKQILKNETPLKYSAIPSYTDAYEIKPYELEDTSRVIDSTYNDYPPIPLDSGRHVSIYGDTTCLPGGILISDRKASLYIFYKAGWKRQQKELVARDSMYHNFRNKMKKAETYYQDKIGRLKEEARRSWIEENMGYLGFGAGILTCLLLSFTLGH